MKRQLTKEEKILCRKGINVRKKKIAELKKELSYFTEFNAFNKKWEKYLEEKELKAKERKKMIIEQTLKELKESLEFEQNTMTGEKRQLTEGVEIKKMTGVN